MKVSEAVVGRIYRVMDCPTWECLTIGEVYVCSSKGNVYVGLHRASDGGGTYIRRDEDVELVEMI